MAKLLRRTGVVLLMVASALGASAPGCAEHEPETPTETGRFALEACFDESDCAPPPPCTTLKCVAGECRHVPKASGCCIQNTDCDLGDLCLKGICNLPEEGLEGSCSYFAHPAKPGCCNYPFECDLAPPGYVAVCNADPQAGYKKCDWIIDPESCVPPFINLVINEFMANPASADEATGEWVELFNPSLDPIYLNGWSLSDNDADSFTIVSALPVLIEPGQYFLMARSDNSENNGHLTPDYVYYNFTLSNGTDEIVLKDPQGVEIDRVEYGPPEFTATEGTSLELASPYMDNNNPINWRTAQKPQPPFMDKGTPGQANTDGFFFYFTPVACNDNNSCTLDTCGTYGNPVCTHNSISECCLYNTDCSDDNLCTIDTCKPATLTCIHTKLDDCCNYDEDCTETTSCTTASCKNHKCRYLVKPDRPNCCMIDADCVDINPCTIDFCSQDPGTAYKTCHHKSPGGVECCLVNLDCEDGTNDTIDTCMNYECQHTPNPEFCVGPPPAYCNDNAPCTADACDMANNLCTHTPVAGCCIGDSDCDDDNPCTKDLCQEAIHSCVFAPVDGCCHINQDCEGFMTDQDLCKNAICVNSKCRLQHLPDQNCCLTNNDCKDDDPCTDDVCNPGNNTCLHTSKGKGCCYDVSDCVPDDDPCTTEMCVKNKCLSAPVKGCCKGDWECEDGNPCTTDGCLDYQCRFAADVKSNCCLTTQDCAKPCSSCRIVTCTPGHYCVETGNPDCTVHPNWHEKFDCQKSLEALGWSTTASSIGKFSIQPGVAPLGFDPAAVIAVDTSIQAGKACLTSPSIAVQHPQTPLTVSFEQLVLWSSEVPAASSATFSLAALPAGTGNQKIILATFDGSTIDGRSPTTVKLPLKVKTAPFQLSFCAELKQGSLVTSWSIDSVKVGQGSPPRFLELVEDVWMLPGDLLEFPFQVTDDDGTVPQFYLAGPKNASLGQVSELDENTTAVSLILAPQDEADIGTQFVYLTASDGFFTDRRSFIQTVYIPKCDTVQDCDDANSCTVDTCNPVTGCNHEMIDGCCSDLTPCDDLDLCTQDVCNTGTCEFSPVTCFDDNPCTNDSCKPDQGCLFPFNNDNCNDDNICTWHDICFKGECVGLPLDCTDNLLCTLDSCLPGEGCQHKSLCSDNVLCTTDVCTSKGCKSGKVPVGSPYVEGIPGDDWTASTVQGTGQGVLGSVSMLLDELNLYIALEMAPTPDSGAAVYIDSDFGIQTGVDDFSILTAEDTGIDAMFSPSLAVEFDGFGADFVVAFQWGPDPSQGLNGAGCYEILPDKSVSFVPCLVALSEDGFMEATIPWYLIYGDEPPDHEVSAFVVAALDQAGAKLDTIPTTPIDLFIDIMLFGVPDAQCLVSFCGDGIIDSGEECDDAALNNDDLPDTCRTNCLSPWCGDSVIDAGETCDDGQDNNDFLADHCRTNCTPPYCGDNVLDGDEECDNGIENNDELFDHCRTNCLLPFCGDGVQDSLEQCDQGQDNSDFLPDTCRTDCLLPYCGDNVTDDAEECDDGDDNSNVVADACRENCLAAWCGDEIQDSNEECDLGVNNNDEMPDTCRTNCLMAHCGDGALDDGEECDDGNTADWDGCQADCVVYITQCNDGVKTPNEECDWGDLNNDFEPDACRTTCVFAYCGDGIIDSGEICDDGNQEGGDECGLDCKPYVPFCGNGWIDDGEECDDGDDNSNFLPDQCRKNCSLPFCGDTVIDSNEVCDKGGANSDELPNACRTNCLPAWCGDSVIDNGEQCDDGPGNANEANKCKTDCTLPECGDGVLDDLYLEECDWGDSNTNELVDSCRTDCLNAHCGDNIIDTGEECDDGNDILGDGCAPDCTIETYVPDPGDIIITEIMQNPAKVYDTLGEYFEVYNTRDYEIDISGWEIADSEAEQHQIANGGPLLVPALGYLVLGIENDIDLNGGILVDYEYSDILLGNGSDELYLSYKGAISDEVAYDGGPDFPDPKGASMNLAPSKFNFIANDNGANWCEAWSPLSSGDKGTPGEANDSCP